MLLADCTESGALRGYARAEPTSWRPRWIGTATPDAAALLGQGYLAFTVDQGADRERQQGIVSHRGRELAEMALHYFRTSEQLQCALRLACRADGSRVARLGTDPGAGRQRGRDRGVRVPRTTRPGMRPRRWRRRCATSRVAGRHLAIRPADLAAVQCGGGGGGPAPRARLRLPLLPLPLVRHPGGLRRRTTSMRWRWPERIVMTCEFCNLDFRFDRDDVRGRAGGTEPRPAD